MLDSFAVVKAAVLAGDAIGLAPLSAIETELRSGKLALIPFDAPWLHMSYGLFYPRKQSLSRAAQLFVTQLRQVETAIQEREQRALARMNPGGKARRKTAKTRAAGPPRTQPGADRQAETLRWIAADACGSRRVRWLEASPAPPWRPSPRRCASTSSTRAARTPRSSPWTAS